MRKKWGSVSAGLLERTRGRGRERAHTHLPIQRHLRLCYGTLLRVLEMPQPPVFPNPLLSMGKVAACFEGDSVPRRAPGGMPGSANIFKIAVSPRFPDFCDAHQEELYTRIHVHVHVRLRLCLVSRFQFNASAQGRPGLYASRVWLICSERRHRPYSQVQPSAICSRAPYVYAYAMHVNSGQNSVCCAANPLPKSASIN